MRRNSSFFCSLSSCSFFISTCLTLFLFISASFLLACPFALVRSVPSSSFVACKGPRRRASLVFSGGGGILQRNFLTPRLKPRLVILATLRSLVPAVRETATEAGRTRTFLPSLLPLATVIHARPALIIDQSVSC